MHDNGVNRADENVRPQTGGDNPETQRQHAAVGFQLHESECPHRRQQTGQNRQLYFIQKEERADDNEAENPRQLAG